MANKASKAILRALIEGVLTDLMVKTTGEMVYLDDSTTVAAKIADMVTAINARAKTTDMNAAISTAVSNLKNELMGEGVPEAYDTFKELADYIASHQEAADALTAAVGNKADKTTVQALQATINALGSLAKKSTVSEADLDASLKAKVNAAAEGNHSHDNKSVLDGITADDVTEWDSKGSIFASKTQPSNFAAGDLWFALVD